MCGCFLINTLKDVLQLKFIRQIQLLIFYLLQTMKCSFFDWKQIQLFCIVMLQFKRIRYSNSFISCVSIWSIIVEIQYIVFENCWSRKIQLFHFMFPYVTCFSYYWQCQDISTNCFLRFAKYAMPHHYWLFPFHSFEFAV